ncbi:MAG: serine/threonine-protein kinase [Saccharofermentanales bacterium]
MLKKGTKLFATFDEYTIIEQIGQGGNGTVFKAKNSDNEIIAIKAFDKNNESLKKRKRFKNEINFCQKFKHENMINVYEYGTYIDSDVDIIFYSMPYYPDTLRKLMDIGILHNEILPIFLKILYGLEYAHKQKVWHRDIKPENILVNGHEIVIVDFGIAHFNAEQIVTSIQTIGNEKLANYKYAAPEQRIKNAIIDGKADIFALGLILNEMFTGQIIAGAKPKIINDIDTEYSYLDDLVDEMICQNPNDRIPSIEKVILELKILIDKKKDSDELIQLMNTKIIEAQKNDEMLVPELKDIKYEENNLILIINSSVPPEWINIFQNGAFSHHYMIDFNTNNYKIESKGIFNVLYRNHDENIIRDVIRHFKEWLPIVTDEYNRLILSNKKAAQQKQEKQRCEEIAQKEKEMRIKEKLKNLL